MFNVFGTRNFAGSYNTRIVKVIDQLKVVGRLVILLNLVILFNPKKFVHKIKQKIIYQV
jgi:hypothetical protein